MEDQTLKWLEWVRALIMPFLGYLAWLQRDILHQLRLLNGKVGRLEVRQDEHEKHDEQRVADLHDRVIFLERRS